MAINCKAAFDLLLESDPAELAGRGDTELAAHVKQCARCGAVAAKLLEGQEELAGALDAMRPRTGVDDALSAARTRRQRRSWRRNAWRMAAPLAAAAVVAGVFVVRSANTSRMPGELVVGPAPRIEPVVEMPVAQNTLVFETEDKSAKVIWFY
jgi:anti-sigma factor RsiW